MAAVAAVAATGEAAEAAATENRSGAPYVQSPMNLRRAALLAAGATALLAAPGIASASAGDPLGCSPAVFDPGDDVDAAALAPLIDAAERTLDAEIQVRVEQVVDGGLDDRIGQLVAQCPGWEEGTNELADDRIVVMFSPTERESALYYGANHADTLDDGWESVVDAMTSDLRAGDYDGAAEAAMRRLRAVTAESSTSAADDSGPGFPTGWLVLIGAVGIVGVIYQLYRGGTAGEGTDGGSEWNSGSSGRQRSFSSWSSSRSSSSGGGGRSSSRSSGRAGGGSKKW